MKNKKQFVVFGLGRFGSSLARELAEQDQEVLAVDSRMESVEEISNFVTNAVCADATEEAAFRRLEVQQFDVAIIAIGENIRDSVLIAMQCKEAGVPMVIAKVNDALHARVMEKLGVDRVVYAERDMAVRLANKLVRPNVVDMGELGRDLRLVQRSVPAGWSHKSIGSINIRRRYGVTLLTIRRGDRVISDINADTELEPGDVLLLIGNEEATEDLGDME